MSDGFRSALFLLGLSGSGGLPPVVGPYVGDAYYYDTSGGTGSVTGGDVQPGPIQGEPTGSISGGTVMPSETDYG